MPKDRQRSQGYPIKLHKRTLAITRNSRFGFLATKWPRNRPGPGTPNQQAQRQNFALATTNLNKVDSGMQIAARAVTANSQWTYKDRLISLMYGRSMEATLKDGTIIQGWREQLDYIQQALDTITDVVGAILTRTADGWRGLAAGQEGFVLTSTGYTTPPVWAQAQGGGSGAALSIGGMLPLYCGNASSLVNTRLHLHTFMLPAGTRLSGIGLPVYYVSGSPQIEACCYSFTGQYTGSLQASSAPTEVTSTGVFNLDFDEGYVALEDQLIRVGFLTHSGTLEVFGCTYQGFTYLNSQSSLPSDLTTLSGSTPSTSPVWWPRVTPQS